MTTNLRRKEPTINKTLATIDKADTGLARSQPSACDIDMTKVTNLRIEEQSTLLNGSLQVYDKLPFDNPDGGVWKQVGGFYCCFCIIFFTF